MSIIIICCGEKFIVSYSHTSTFTSSSEHINYVVELSGDNNVVVPIDDVYCSVVGTYVEFLRGNKLPITNKQDLLLSFQLDTLFIDDDYFKYLVQKVFNNWTDVNTIVYDDFNDDLQWFFFVYSPYDFIPKHLLDNDNFMKQWNKLNQGTIIKVDSNAIYYNNVDTTDVGAKNISTYHTVNGKKIGNEISIIYYQLNNNIRFETSYLYYKLGDKIVRKMNGPSRNYYNNDRNTLESETYYIKGVMNGSSRKWNDDKQHTLKFDGYYDNGENHGFWAEWYNGDGYRKPMYEGSFVHGERDGLWRVWYWCDTGTLNFEGHYVNGKRDGHWIEFDEDGNTTFDGYYIGDVKQT